MAILVIVDGALVVSASDKAMPGDILYQLDLAVEKIQIYLAPISDQPVLKFKAIDERISEVEQLIKTRRLEVGQNTIVFSSRESGDINIALEDVSTFLEKETDQTRKTKIERRLAELLALIELNRNVKIEKHKGPSSSYNEMEVEGEDLDD